MTLLNKLTGALERPPAPLPADFQAAAMRLVDPSALKTARYRDRRVWDYTGVRPEMVDFANSLLKELERRKMPFFVHGAFRGENFQNALFKQGTSKARFGQSAHNFGMAVDIVHLIRAWDLTRKEWAVVGHIGLEVARKRNIKVVWGGSWNFYDPAHWELAEWKSLKPKAA